LVASVFSIGSSVFSIEASRTVGSGSHVFPMSSTDVTVVDMEEDVVFVATAFSIRAPVTVDSGSHVFLMSSTDETATDLKKAVVFMARTDAKEASDLVEDLDVEVTSQSLTTAEQGSREL
jgi:hypothetical protein